jgi:diguanylate cyclase (GGDEF)-like protein
MIIGYIYNFGNLKTGIIVATIIPLLVAPFMAWHMTKLFLHTNQLEVKMRKLANTDSLTQVMSRNACLDNTEKLLIRTQDRESSLALFYVDIDNFKTINDTYGHEVGDKFLAYFARLLNNNMPKGSIVGRLGGDEFLLTLTNTDIINAKKFANTLFDYLKENHFVYQGLKIECKASIGISIFDKTNQPALDEFIIQADIALYLAKNSTKGIAIVHENN